MSKILAMGGLHNLRGTYLNVFCYVVMFFVLRDYRFFLQNV